MQTDAQRLMTTPGERQHEWEKNTWPVLKDLAANHPDAGIHFQQTKLFIRKRDLGTEKAEKYGQKKA
jgi:D-amino-acid oxidase